MKKTWQLLNSLAERATQGVAGVVVANARLLALTIGVGVFAHGYQLTHFTFSIDEEVMWQNPYTDAWLQQRRWGMHLLQKLMPEAIYPFTTAAIAIVLLSVAGVLLVDRLQARPPAKMIFCSLFISFPTFAHIQLFDYMGAFVAFGVLLVVVTEKLVAAAQQSGVRLLVPATCALSIATASYQSLIFVFLTVVAFRVTADAFQNVLSFKTAARRIGLNAIVAVSALIVFYAVDLVWSPGSSGYVESQFRWGSANSRILLAALLGSAVPFLTGLSLTHATLPTALVPALLLILLATRSERRLLTCGLTIALIISPLAIHLAFGTWMAARSMMALPVAFAGLWYLLFSLSPPLVRAGIAAFTVYALVLHSSLISRASFAQEVAYRADVVVAGRILDLIYDVRPRLAEDQTPLAFVGSLDPPRSMLFAKDEVFGGSFWQWDRGNPYRMRLFLQALGLPVSVQIAPHSEWPRAHALAKDMPAWPDRGCVQLRDGLVVVKLSETN